MGGGDLQIGGESTDLGVGVYRYERVHKWWWGGGGVHCFGRGVLKVVWGSMGEGREGGGRMDPMFFWETERI